MPVMDKNDALKISKRYLRKLKRSDFRFSEAWLFGSFAKNTQHNDSDIDLAIVLDDQVPHTFESDVKLMVFRKGEETLIEPHLFSREEFDSNLPLVNQIVRFGENIYL